MGVVPFSVKITMSRDDAEQAKKKVN